MSGATLAIAGAGGVLVCVQFALLFAWASRLVSQRERLLLVAALALERVQVDDADEAEALLSQVVTLDGEYVPRST